VQNTPQIYLDIDAAMRRQDMERAMELARQALDSGLSHPVLFNLRAYWHETAGLFDDACADLEMARELTPRDPVILNALGRCLTGAGRHYQAIAACEAALAENPNFAMAHYNKGCAHEQLGELAAADLAYRNALRIDSTVADALARLAGLVARRGRHAEARDLAERALSLTPKHAIAQLAHIVSDLSERKFTDAELRARKVIEEPLTTAQARANALSFLGDALDGQARFTEAFACYAQANTDLKAIFHQQFEGRETGCKLAQRLDKEFGMIPSDKWRCSETFSKPTETAQSLAFLVGFPRAGTTLLGQILASHSHVTTIVERPLLGMALREFVETPGGLARLAELPQREIERHRARFWQNVQALGISVREKLLVEQTPLNTLHLPVIAKLFPEAKIVFALRDPRDVVLSCFRRLFVLNDYVYEFLTLQGSAQFYDETMKLAQLFRERLPLSLSDIRNEDLVADFEGQARALCGFLGLEWEDSMRKFADSASKRHIATPSALQVTRGLSKEGVGHWQNYREQLEPVLPLLAPWLNRFGYV
jgi:tetratricopeptide (TPR) repeat protein